MTCVSKHQYPACSLADVLSDRQLECLRLAASGLPSSAIGGRIGISPRTVDEHLAGACQTLGVRTRIQAVAHLAMNARSVDCTSPAWGSEAAVWQQNTDEQARPHSGPSEPIDPVAFDRA